MRSLTITVLPFVLSVARAPSSAIRQQTKQQSQGMPHYRFKLWRDLDSTAVEHTTTLNYVEATWNVPGQATIEKLSYSTITTEGESSTARRDAVDGLGFTEAVWDCFMNHYFDYNWDELIEGSDFNVRQYFETLGWTQERWDNDDPPDSYDDDWESLTSEQQEAATELCYTQEIWDGVALDAWEEMPQVPDPTPLSLDRELSQGSTATAPPIDAPPPSASVSSPSTPAPTPTPSDIPRWQQLVLAITPKCMASISIPCSAFLIYEVFCDYRKDRVSSIKRALVGMSIIDTSSSFAWFLSTWAVPRGNFALSAGTRGSCTFQGFLLQLAVGAPLYNSSLALFYLLIIKYRWTDKDLIPIERWVHAFILFFAIGTSILLLPLEQYNHIGAVCWVIGDPKECGSSSFQSGDEPCHRGNHAWLYGLLLFYGPLWVCVFACCVSMVFIYLEFQKNIKRMNRYSISGRMIHAMGRSQSESKRIAVQAALYSLSFLITWMPSTIWSIAHWFNWSSFWIDFAAAFCEPLQGLWNFCIFARTRKETQGKIWQGLSKLFPCCIKFDPRDFSVSRHGSVTLRSGHRPPSSLISRCSAGSNSGAIADLGSSSPMKQQFGISSRDLAAFADLDGGGSCSGSSSDSENNLDSVAVQLLSVPNFQTVGSKRPLAETGPQSAKEEIVDAGDYANTEGTLQARTKTPQTAWSSDIVNIAKSIVTDPVCSASTSSVRQGTDDRNEEVTAKVEEDENKQRPQVDTLYFL